MQTSYVIRLQNGFEVLDLGSTSDQARNQFVKPDKTDILNGLNTGTKLVWHYWDFGSSLFLDPLSDDHLRS
jgi:hypothetical protein